MLVLSRRWRTAPTLLLAFMAVPPTAPGQAVPAAEYRARREAALDRLPGRVLLLRARSRFATDGDPGFRQEPDFYYYTGLENLLGGILVLDGAARDTWLLLPRLTRFAAFTAADQPLPSDSLARRLLVDHVAPLDTLVPWLTRRLAESAGLVVRLPSAGFGGGPVRTPPDSSPLENAAWHWREAIARRWPQAVIAADSVTPSLRLIKRAPEIATLRRVGAASAAAVLAALGEIAPGRRQRPVEGVVVAACLAAGGDGPSFWPWVLSGPAGAFPQPWRAFGDYHHLDRTMAAGELVRLDLGCEVDHYMGDVGRTIPVSGSFDPGQRETWDLLVRAYRAGLARIRDGARVDEVMDASFREVARLRDSLTTPLARHAAALMAIRDSVPSWQLHGIGLEPAESLPEVLRVGMVLDYEPILTVEGQGFYLEDMILVEPGGFAILTPGLPYTALEIERAMRRP